MGVSFSFLGLIVAHRDVGGHQLLLNKTHYRIGISNNSCKSCQQFIMRETSL